VSSNAHAICARGLGKRYRIYHRRSVSLKHRVVTALRGGRDAYEEFLALENVCLDVPRGQVLGILGANGSGKSTLLKILARVLEPDTGSVVVRGRVSAILELGAGFQPDLSGRRNVYLYGSLLGLRRKEIAARLDEIVAFSELERFIDNPVRYYSSGMHVRLAYAIGAHVDADVLLLDEVLAVGDASFRAKCLAHIHRLKAAGKTIVLVSHSMPDVEELCDRAIVLAHGRVVFDDAAPAAIAAYQAGVA
jgi:ABC-2 type transport system ATP-binding protein